MSFGFGFGFPRRLTSGGGLSPSLYLDFVGTGVLPSTVTFSRGTNATLTDSNGRVAYAPHNLLTNSEDFEAAGWTKASTSVAANTIAAPDATSTADTIICAAATTLTAVYGAFTSVASNYTWSVYVRQKEVRFVQLLWTGASSVDYANFDLQTGTLTAGTYLGASITPAGNNWYRITITSALIAGSTSPYLAFINASSNARATSFVGNGTSGIFVWGAQLNIANAPVNLLTWSEDFTNAAWAKGAGVTVTPNATVAPDLTTTADNVAFATGGVLDFLRSVPTMTVGVVYTVSVYALRVSGTPTFSFDIGNGGGGGSTAQTPTTSWQRFSFTFTFAGANSWVDLEASGPGTIAFWGAQLNTGSVALPYVATTSSIFLPPAYNSTTPKNLLGFTQEPENAAWTKSNSYVQQNLLTWSQDFSNTTAWPPTNITVTNAATTAPDGTNTAQSIASTTTAATLLVSAVATVLATSATYSIYVKQGTGASAANTFIFRNGTTATNLLAGTLNYSTGVFTYSIGSTGVSVQNVGNGWWRLIMTVTSGVTSGDGLRVYVGFSGASETAGTFLYAWGAQLVQGSTAGDYTQTTSAAAPTRYVNWDGTLTGRKFVEDTAAATTHRVFNGTGVTVPTNGAAANIVYAKAGERTAVRLTDNDIQGADFDLLTGVVSNLGTGVTASATNAGGGWWRLSVIRTNSTGTGRVVLYLLSGGTITYTGDGTSGIYVSDFQLSNSASVDPYVYNPQAAAASTAYYGPRFDYDPVTLAAKGLLIEEQRTNLLTYSEQFDNAAWNVASAIGLTVSSDATTAPDGTSSADKLVETATTDIHQRRQIFTSGTAKRFSIYAKAAERTIFRGWSFTGGDTQQQTFNLANGTCSGTLNPIIQNVGNGWFRCSFDIPSLHSTISIGPDDGTGGTLPYSGVAGFGIFIWGAQLEAGSFATSYIPTVASQVTRNADSASMLGDNFYTWYNPNQGTLLTEGGGANAAGSARLAGISDGTVSNRIINYLSGATQLAGLISVGGAAQANPTVNVTSAASANKLAQGYLVNNVNIAANGTLGTLDTVATIPAVTLMRIGADEAGTGAILNGTIRRIGYYNTRLPDSTLQALTT